MRILVLSDIHSNERFDQVYESLKKDRFIDKCKIDKIIVNGNLLGITEMAPGYGSKFNKETFFWDLNREKMFLELAPNTAKKFVQAISTGDFVKSKAKLTELAASFAEERYSWVLTALRKLSKLRHTYFNFGIHESPLHFLVIDELALLLRLTAEEIKTKINEEDLQEVFSRFKQKLEQLEADERFTYISLKSVEEEDAVFIGIPGVNFSSHAKDEDSKIQEKLTLEVLDEARNKVHGPKTVVLCSNAEGITTQEPFNFTPGSESLRAFLAELCPEKFIKVFIQSNRHWVTTHFYFDSGWHCILNNSAVNNGLFNIIEIGRKEVNCWDIDPSEGKVIGLQEYDKDMAEYNTPEERLALNYAAPEEIIEKRQIEDCEHM